MPSAENTWYVDQQIARDGCLYDQQYCNVGKFSRIAVFRDVARGLTLLQCDRTIFWKFISPFEVMYSTLDIARRPA